jgi:hypothetical protein
VLARLISEPVTTTRCGAWAAGCCAIAGAAPISAPLATTHATANGNDFILNVMNTSPSMLFLEVVCARDGVSVTRRLLQTRSVGCTLPAVSGWIGGSWYDQHCICFRRIFSCGVIFQAVV